MAYFLSGLGFLGEEGFDLPNFGNFEPPERGPTWTHLGAAKPVATHDAQDARAMNFPPYGYGSAVFVLIAVHVY